ncbi:MAG: sigma-70 family RNA polymerase sigma factor [Opitutae bacterium]|nr:sigma-70 family RNA polymerase sigma factor [Opitutae bacterium]
MKINEKDNKNLYDSSDNDPIGKFMTDLSKKAPPTREECVELFQRLNQGSESARSELIERHLRLVASITLKFKHSGLPLEDLMAEGITGLIIAIDKFDHRRGLKLGTYAAWWIRQRVQRYISKFQGAVSVPHDVYQGSRRRKGLESQLQVDLGREPTVKEIRNNIGEERNLAKRVKLAPASSTSIDKPISETDITLADLLSSEEDEKMSYREEGSLADDLSVAADFLDNREKKVISMRFGLGNQWPMKLEEISNKLKVSAERIRQIEARSLRKLRAIILRNGKLDFRKLDQLVNLGLCRKAEMSPLELALALKTAA